MGYLDGSTKARAMLWRNMATVRCSTRARERTAESEVGAAIEHI